MCQFPFVVPPKKNTVEDVAGFAGAAGKSPRATSWTMFIVDNKVRCNKQRIFTSWKFGLIGNFGVKLTNRKV